MHTIRRIQLSAVAVVANGLVALATMSPSTALAAGCSSHDYSPGCGCSLTCANFAGCTTTYTCIPLPQVCGTKGLVRCTYS